MVQKLLIATEKFCDGNPAFGDSTLSDILLNVIMHTGLADEAMHFYYDVVDHKVGKHDMMNNFANICLSYQPNLIIVSTCADLAPAKEIFGRVMDITKCKVLYYRPDTKVNDDLSWSPFVTAHGILDSMAAFQHWRKICPCILMYSCVLPRALLKEKDIPISFIGSIDPLKWTKRSEYIDHAQAHGLDVFISGGQRQKKLTYEEYNQCLDRSKITLDFSTDGTGITQLKARVFEAMNSGAMLMEDKGSDAEYFFEKGVDFVSYSSKEDLVEKAKYYLTHDDERQEIALSGLSKVRSRYNHNNLWGWTFQELGIEISKKLSEDPSFIEHNTFMRRFYD